MKLGEPINGVKSMYFINQEEWRSWLKENHKFAKSVWLILYKKKIDIPSLTYHLALEEALCFGWIDSKKKSRDDESYYHLFSKRKEKSYWSQSNKSKIDRLISEKRIQSEGLRMVDIAKKSDTWDALNDVENLIVPVDLETEFLQYKSAKTNWDGFSASSRKSILLWIFQAKRVETRIKRIQETARLANQNIKANQ